MFVCLWALSPDFNKMMMMMMMIETKNYKVLFMKTIKPGLPVRPTVPGNPEAPVKP